MAAITNTYVRIYSPVHMHTPGHSSKHCPTLGNLAALTSLTSQLASERMERLRPTPESAPREGFVSRSEEPFGDR